MRLHEEWNGIPTDGELLATAQELGLSLLWDRSGPHDFEERRWTVSIGRGSWPAPAPRGIADATTAEVRAYLVGMYEMRRWHRERLREIREAVEGLT